MIVAWECDPFATLIFLTSLQSLDREQIEAARMDGAGPFAIFRFSDAPHLARPIAVVVMLETIFFLVQPKHRTDVYQQFSPAYSCHLDTQRNRCGDVEFLVVLQACKDGGDDNI